jgi:hypothetical protein
VGCFGAHERDGRVTITVATAFADSAPARSEAGWGCFVFQTVFRVRAGGLARYSVPYIAGTSRLSALAVLRLIVREAFIV